MMRLILLTSVSLLLCLFSSGCTDFVEPNQLAFVLGTAIDHAESGSIEVSLQIAIPSQMSGPFKGGAAGSSDSFLVMSAKGKDVYEATQKIQREMSRRLITSHRIIIAISEEYFTKNDVHKLFDKLGRDPANNQRDITIMIKGSSAKEFLLVKHPMEHLSSIGAGKELLINGLKNYSTRQFIIDSVSAENRPLVPVLQIKKTELSHDKTDPIAVLSGFAVLNDKLKINGILDDQEGSETAWMSGKRSLQGITIPGKNNEGQLSFRLTHLKRKIQSNSRHDPEHLALTVKAQAYLLENTTSLDMSEVENMVEVQKHLNEHLQKELQGTLDKVQHWGPDVFGIGGYLHRKYPHWWNSQKGDWDENFKKVEVTVQADIQLRSAGVSGGPLN